ncbi:NADPH-dependent FMN reductase [Vibrio breoganii]|uniref:NADPH-dependent FMN reductase n=1 Tax=Vibrio breoganii TaxID=553239 RepID=UPI000474B48F|nr:NAD(P)H-dependent oxidoreductase [Vibrio breoganii]OCH76860.1 flavoprotein [Vibrio breoganii]OED95755.1 flavoprotein [Vibrio breoganii ZF-55]
MNILIFLGSSRTSGPPRPKRLGERVSLACSLLLDKAFPGNSIEIIDPLDYDTGGIFKPEFAYSRQQVPQDLETLANKIKNADAYVMVSPEYNHSMSPALAHLLNHFGSSLFSFKPSAIVTYSAGQWGGARAAVSMRTFLSELGCLPVSAMVHLPSAQDVFDETGNTINPDNQQQWDEYLYRTLSQMMWWAQASQQHRQQIDPLTISKAFTHSPSQRNAPVKI